MINILNYQTIYNKIATYNQKPAGFKKFNTWTQIFAVFFEWMNEWMNEWRLTFLCLCSFSSNLKFEHIAHFILKTMNKTSQHKQYNNIYMKKMKKKWKIFAKITNINDKRLYI